MAVLSQPGAGNAGHLAHPVRADCKVYVAPTDRDAGTALAQVLK
jgi:hypothetical protein